MKTYRLKDTRTCEIRDVDLATAAKVMGLDPDEIRWCLEEYGVCETGCFELTPQKVLP